MDDDALLAAAMRKIVKQLDLFARGGNQFGLSFKNDDPVVVLTNEEVHALGVESP